MIFTKILYILLLIRFFSEISLTSLTAIIFILFNNYLN